MSDLPAPVVSIITPTKNRAALLRECIASVQAQTLMEWEHLIIDDGSDDATAEVMAEIIKSDPRIRYLQRSSAAAGANVCRNQGLQESKAPFVIFLDSDDLLLPNCLETRMSLMDRNSDLDFAVYQTGFFVKVPGDRHQQTASEIFGDDLCRFLSFDLPWIITAPIWRKQSLEKLQGFDATLPSWQDVDLHIRAVCRQLKYVKIPKVDHQVRWQFDERKISVMQRRSPKHLEAAAVTLAKFENEVRRGPGMDWVRQRALCGLYFMVAECWVAIGNRSAARTFWCLSFKRGLAPRHLWLQGQLWLLCMASQTKESSLMHRLLNKWKGLVRFRNVPALVH